MNKIFNCPFEVFIDMLRGKWKLVILWHLNKEGCLRFSELQKATHNPSTKVLSTQLRQLEDDGFIYRKVYPEVPPRVEYHITELGRSLWPLLISMQEWSISFLESQNVKVDDYIYEELNELIQRENKKVEVVPYDTKWKVEFERASSTFYELLENLNVRIEHVGSTSVEGLWAKPILDIDIVVPNSEVCLEVIEKLQSVGYKHVGNYGVEGREAFRYSKDNEFINWMPHNLYVCIEGTENLENHLKLRNHLRNNKSAREAYGKLKKELAEKYPYDIDSYVEEKTKLITSFLEKEGMSAEALDRIISINKKDK